MFRDVFSRITFVGIATVLLAIFLAGCAQNRDRIIAHHVQQFEGQVVAHPENDPVIQASRSNLVSIMIVDAKGKIQPGGTAFYIRSNQVMTCLHVIDTAHSLQVRMADGTQYPVAGVFGSDPLMDAVVLWVTNPPPVPEPLRLREKPAQISEKVFALAALKELPITTSKGVVTDLLDQGDSMLNSGFRFSAPILPGFSGGPVLDAGGAVVGMTSEYYFTPEQRDSVAIPAGEIAQLAEGNPVSFSEWRQQNPMLPPAAATAMAQGSRWQLKPKTALPHFEKAASLAPYHVQAWLRKAGCLIALNRPAEAISALQKAVQLQPEKIHARLALAFLLATEKRPTEALEQADAIIDRRPNQPGGYMVQALALLGRNDIRGAFEAGRTALKLAPERPGSHFTMGTLCLALGLPDLAVPYLAETTRLQSNNATAWRLLGTARRELGQDGEAKRAFTAVAAKKWTPDRAGARYLLFSIALRNHEEKIAFQEYDSFLKEERARLNNTPLSDHGVRKAATQYRRAAGRNWRSLEAHQNITTLFAQTERPMEMVAAMEVCTQIAPKDAVLWSHLAAVYVQTCRYEKGRDAAIKALQLNPKTPDAQRWLGFALTALGEHREAKEAFYKSLKVDGEKAETYLGLACVEAKDGNREAARILLARAPKLSEPIPQAFLNAPQRFIPEAREIRRAATATVSP